MGLGPHPAWALGRRTCCPPLRAGTGADEQWPDQHEHQQPAALDDERPALFEALRAKEGVVLASEGEEDGYGGAAGREAAVGWASRAVAQLGFSALAAAYSTAASFTGARSGSATNAGWRASPPSPASRSPLRSRRRACRCSRTSSSAPPPHGREAGVGRTTRP